MRATCEREGVAANSGRLVVEYRPLFLGITVASVVMVDATDKSNSAKTRKSIRGSERTLGVNSLA